jgi:phosphatidate cytidylyltransferase
MLPPSATPLPSSSNATGGSARPVSEAPAHTSPSSGFGLRLVSALVLAPVVLALTWLGTPYFEAMVLIGAMILLREWSRMSLDRPNRGLWLAAGLVYVAGPCFALVWLRAGPDGGRTALFWLFAVVWAADTGAYLAGRAVGGPKLAPAISPSKTWAGLIGGLIAAAAAGYLVSVYLGSGGGDADTVAVLIVSAAVGFVAEMGDLLESWIKRRLAVKDSGALIPGHGGLLDRVDGLLAAAVATALLAALGEGRMLPW